MSDSVKQYKNILILDDSDSILLEVAQLLKDHGYSPHPASTCEVAEKIIASVAIDFAVVDLFLLGDRGAELSNSFITRNLTNIPYLRLTGDPHSVPQGLEGYTVIDKYDFKLDPKLLVETIQEAELVYSGNC